MNIIRNKLKITPLTRFGIRNFPDYEERIDKIDKLQSVNLIVIDGRTQTGKTTFARFLAQKRDKDYKLFFTVRDILTYFKKFEFGRWLVFDEPQLEVSRARFWDERNLVMSCFVSAYGFTKNHLIMCLPSIRGISDIMLTNISLRITMTSDLGKDDEIVRTAQFKIPKFSETKNKYIWVRVERVKVPQIPDDLAYNKRKLENFYEKLEEWDKRLNKDRIDANQTPLILPPNTNPIPISEDFKYPDA